MHFFFSFLFSVSWIWEEESVPSEEDLMFFLCIAFLVIHVRPLRRRFLSAFCTNYSYSFLYDHILAFSTPLYGKQKHAMRMSVFPPVVYIWRMFWEEEVERKNRRLNSDATSRCLWSACSWIISEDEPADSLRISQKQGCGGKLTELLPLQLCSFQAVLHSTQVLSTVQPRASSLSILSYKGEGRRQVI